MNIPENILKAVADAAFLPSSKIRLTTSNIFDDWKNQAKDRLAVIQHALDNPALAPFLAGEAIARAEKAEAELASLKGDMLIAERAVDNVMRILPELVKSPSWEDAATSVREHIDKLQEEIDSLKSSLPDAEATPPAEPEPAALVPLGPEDVPPFSQIRCPMKTNGWSSITSVDWDAVWVGNKSLSWTELAEHWQINTSIRDTGQWDANAWRSCSKPGK
jgi:hypothetical protein